MSLPVINLAKTGNNIKRIAKENGFSALRQCFIPVVEWMTIPDSGSGGAGSNPVGDV